MDQQTQIILAVLGGLALLFMLGFGIFAWRAMNKVAHRRFNPRSPTATPLAPLQQMGWSDGRCECPPRGGPDCIPAKLPQSDNTPHAIYGLSQSDCCTNGKMTQPQLQRLVDMVNQRVDRAEEGRLLDLLGQLSDERKTKAASK